VPNAYVYNGHLLDSSGSAITTSHTIRFSYWKSADYVSTDTTATGAINTGASNYANWNEVDTVTPDSNGYFSVRLGSGTSLPSLANYSPAELQNLFLQVEVKSASDPDTSYEILDSDTARTTVDRSPILSVPFALNADRLDQRDTGTGSGSIPVLLTGGLLPVSAIPGGTNEITFIIDKNTTSSTDITLMFGGSLAKRLWYDTITNQFNFDDDLHVTGNITGSGTFTVAGAAIFGSTVQLNGVTYTFPASDGTASGKILKTNGAGQLVWGNAGRSSGAIIGLRPEYPNSVYFGSGANAVGTLSLRHSSGGTVTNYYRWQSTKTTNQHYWIATQIRLPDTFQTWEASKPLQLQYRTSSGSIAVFMQDTASNPVTLSGNTNLQSSTWATATITGPNTSGTWTPGGDFTIFLRLTNSGATILDRTYTDLGSLNINVEEGLP
jgi:hypothetical protein